jgi:F-type H+-transporting ATPase subunit alpha
MTTLLQEIEERIAAATEPVIKRHVGVIREVGDGVARVEGLGDVMLNEMLDLGHGVTGLALSLEETDVGVIVLGDDTRLEKAARSAPRGDCSKSRRQGLLGRVVNTLGEPLDGKGRLPRHDVSGRKDRARHHAPAPISQPVQTGIMAIDAMIPIGRGQRELIIGDRATARRPSASTRSSTRRA